MKRNEKNPLEKLKLCIGLNINLHEMVDLWKVWIFPGQTKLLQSDKLSNPVSQSDRLSNFPEHWSQLNKMCLYFWAKMNLNLLNQVDNHFNVTTSNLSLHATLQDNLQDGETHIEIESQSHRWLQLA